MLPLLLYHIQFIYFWCCVMYKMTFYKYKYAKVFCLSEGILWDNKS
jgi:hypothetical protein